MEEESINSARVLGVTRVVNRAEQKGRGKDCREQKQRGETSGGGSGLRVS